MNKVERIEQDLIKQLDNLRQSKGLSVRAFAQSTGMAQQNMHNLLNNNHRPMLRIYLSVLDGLGLKVNVVKKGKLDLSTLDFGLSDILDVVKLERAKYDINKSKEDDALIQLDKLESSVINSLDNLYDYKENLKKGKYEHLQES